MVKDLNGLTQMLKEPVGVVKVFHYKAWISQFAVDFIDDQSLLQCLHAFIEEMKESHSSGSLFSLGFEKSKRNRSSGSTESTRKLYWCLETKNERT